MSKRHAIVSVEENGTAVVRDLDSTNGSYVVGSDNGLKRVQPGVDFLLPGSPVRLQFGDVPVDFIRVDEPATPQKQAVSPVPNLFDYAVDDGKQEPDAADMSVDDILNLRAGEPTMAFRRDSVVHRASQMAAAAAQSFPPQEQPAPEGADRPAQQDEESAAPSEPAERSNQAEPAEEPEPSEPSEQPLSLNIVQGAGDGDDQERDLFVDALSQSDDPGDLAQGRAGQTAADSASTSESRAPSEQTTTQGRQSESIPVQTVFGSPRLSVAALQATPAESPAAAAVTVTTDVTDAIRAEAEAAAKTNVAATAESAHEGTDKVADKDVAEATAASTAASTPASAASSTVASGAASSADATAVFTPAFEPGSVFERVSQGEFSRQKPAVEVDGLTSEQARTTTDFTEQFEIARHRQLLPFLAMNPSLYDDLYAWLAAQGSEDIDAALAKNAGYDEYRSAVGK